MNPPLAQMIFWVAAASCAVAHVALIWSVLAGPASDSYPEDRRKGPRRGGMRWGPDRRSSATESGSSSSRELEIGWALLPALALAALLTATWLALPA
ncbi:MAG: hypothetical protein ACSLFE_12505 [Gemmatimonadaceae bacterium]